MTSREGRDVTEPVLLAFGDRQYTRSELNALTTREAGQVITEIGLAPTRPAEFIVVSVQHRAGTTELI